MDYQTEENKVKSDIALKDHLQYVSDGLAMEQIFLESMEIGKDFSAGFYKGWWKSREFFLSRAIERNDDLEGKFKYLQWVERHTKKGEKEST